MTPGTTICEKKILKGEKLSENWGVLEVLPFNRWGYESSELEKICPKPHVNNTWIQKPTKTFFFKFYFVDMSWARMDIGSQRKRLVPCWLQMEEQWKEEACPTSSARISFNRFGEKCQKRLNYCPICTCCETALIAKHFSFLHQDFFQNFQLSCLFKYKLFRGEIDPYYYNFLTFLSRVKGEAFKQQHTVNAGVNWNTSRLNMPVIWHDLQIPSFSPSEPTHWINTVWTGNMNHKVSLAVLNAWQLAFLNIHLSKWFFFFT